LYFDVIDCHTRNMVEARVTMQQHMCTRKGLRMWRTVSGLVARHYSSIPNSLLADILVNRTL